MPRLHTACAPCTLKSSVLQAGRCPALRLVATANVHRVALLTHIVKHFQVIVDQLNVRAP